MRPNDVIRVNTIHGKKDLLVKIGDIISIKGCVLKYYKNGTPTNVFISQNEQNRLKALLKDVTKPSIFDKIKSIFS